MNMVQFTETIIKPNDDVESVASDDSVVQPISKHIYQQLDEQDKRSYERVRMVLQNYLLIRILLNRVLLSPWNCSVCAKPSTDRVPTVLLNQRILASVLYEIIRTVDNTLPPIQDVHAAKLDPTGALPIVNSSAKGPIIDENNSLIVKPIVNNDESPSLLIDKVQHIEYKQLEDIANKTDTISIYLAKIRNFHLNIYNFGVYIYNSSLESVGSGHKHLLKLEESLLNPREEYESLEVILSYLIPCDKPSSLGTDLYRIREKYILPWCKEYSVLLADWIDRLAIHVLKAKLKLKEIPIPDENHALDS